MSSFPGLQDFFEKDDVLFSALPWAILSRDKLAGYMHQESIIGHKCDQFDVVQFLDEEDALRGECWWCKESIPESVQALWQLHNMDKIPEMRQYMSDEEWENMSPDKRFNKDTVNVRISHKYKDKPMTWVPMTMSSKSRESDIRNYKKNQTNVHQATKANVRIK